MEIRVGEGTFTLANPTTFDHHGPRRHIYFMLCSLCHADIWYYETPWMADQGPFFQVYCKCGELRSFRKLR